jgi:enolase
VRDTTIRNVVGRRVWTAAGTPALEAEVHLACGARGGAIASPTSGAWSASQPPANAVSAVNGLLAAALHGIDARRQEDVDSTLFKLAVLGDQAITRAALAACSIAAAQAAARAAGVPLFRYLHPGIPARMPLPAVDIVSDPSPTSPFRALMLLPFAADGVDEALALSLAVHRAVADQFGADAVVDERAVEMLFAAIERCGFVPAEEVGIAVDVGASRLYRDGRYLCGGTAYDTDGWGERLVRLVDEYAIASIEDPFADLGGLARFTPLVDERARVVGNQLFASDAERIAAAAADGLASGVVLRPEAAGTLSELRVAFDAARIAAWPVFLAGDASIEDTSLVHLATAWQSGYLKLGGVGRGSLARWNELIRIEAELRPAPSILHIEAAARLVH